MALFQKRHYEWLARFAAKHGLTDELVAKLADELHHDNPNFKPDLFERAVFFRPNHTIPRQ